MRVDLSIRARLFLGAAVMLLAFMAGAGLAVQRAHADSVLAAHYARLQGTVYLLLAGAELDARGALEMPTGLAEPRLSLPGSGLYASIVNVTRGQEWRSPSAVGKQPAVSHQPAAGRVALTRNWASGAPGSSARPMRVKWAGRSVQAPLVLSVLEDRAEFDRELRIFERTLWGWLGGAALLLLLSQTLLLQWGLEPLRRVAQEVARIEDGRAGGDRGPLSGRDLGADRKPQHADRAGAGAADPLQGGAELSSRTA